MRQIKFRVHNKRLNTIFYQKEFQSIKWFFDYVEDRNEDEVMVMQFTGLHDKNGKEIYEGDILKIEQFSFNVNYDKGCFVVQEHPKSEIYFSLSNINEFCKIIGNIYENQELLNNDSE
jgi:hypothetical protein